MNSTDYFCCCNLYYSSNFSIQANVFDWLVYNRTVSSFKIYTASAENRQYKGWFVIGPG